MRLSVVVTCTQPWPEVRGCLDRIAPQARPGEIEVIVADGSAGGLDASAAGDVTWLRLPGRGAHEPRLASVAEAPGGVGAVTQTPRHVAPDLWAAVLAPH